MAPVLRRLLLVALALVGLCACRVDAMVEVTVDASGAGQVRVEALADSELVAAAPRIAEAAHFADLLAAGWTVTGPEPTATGGLRVELVHTFATVAEAEALLASINGPGGPLVGVTLTRTTTATRTEVVLAGTLRMTGGTDAFADADLVAAVGATPYAEEMAATSATLADVFGMRFRADLPGDVSTPAGKDEGGAVSWDVPLDGSAQVIQASGVRSRNDGRWWRLGANAALVSLIVWVAVAVAFLTYVTVARRRAVRRLAPRAPSGSRQL